MRAPSGLNLGELLQKKQAQNQDHCTKMDEAKYAEQVSRTFALDDVF